MEPALRSRRRRRRWARAPVSVVVLVATALLATTVTIPSRVEAMSILSNRNSKKVPSIDQWKLSEKDGTLTGIVTGHPVLQDGDKITTSPLSNPDFAAKGKGTVVTTLSGTKYKLETPKKVNKGPFSLFGGGNKNKKKAEPPMLPSVPEGPIKTTKENIRKNGGIPTIDKWRIDPESGRLTGIVTGHPVLPDGDHISASPPVESFFKKGYVITTETGSRYRLKNPKRGIGGISLKKTPKPPTPEDTQQEIDDQMAKLDSKNNMLGAVAAVGVAGVVGLNVANNDPGAILGANFQSNGNNNLDSSNSIMVGSKSRTGVAPPTSPSSFTLAPTTPLVPAQQEDDILGLRQEQEEARNEKAAADEKLRAEQQERREREAAKAERLALEKREREAAAAEQLRIERQEQKEREAAAAKQKEREAEKARIAEKEAEEARLERLARQRETERQRRLEEEETARKFLEKARLEKEQKLARQQEIQQQQQERARLRLEAAENVKREAERKAAANEKAKAELRERQEELTSLKKQRQQQQEETKREQQREKSRLRLEAAERTKREAEEKVAANEKAKAELQERQEELTSLKKQREKQQEQERRQAIDKADRAKIESDARKAEALAKELEQRQKAERESSVWKTIQTGVKGIAVAGATGAAGLVTSFELRRRMPQNNQTEAATGSSIDRNTTSSRSMGISIEDSSDSSVESSSTDQKPKPPSKKLKGKKTLATNITEKLKFVDGIDDLLAEVETVLAEVDDKTKDKGTAKSATSQNASESIPVYFAKTNNPSKGDRSSEDKIGEMYFGAGATSSDSGINAEASDGPDEEVAAIETEGTAQLIADGAGEIERIKAEESVRLEELARLEAEMEEEELKGRKLQAEEEARLKAEAEARLQAEEEARLKAEEEANLQAAEEARLQAAEEARLKAEVEARLQAEEEARLKAEEEARLQAEEETRLQAEEARLQAEEDASLQAAEEARLQAEEEARLQA
ncbi:unnamed protein product, partial [Pseudo-nitzschia multistriata]